jgi:hypothetical protein
MKKIIIFITVLIFIIAPIGFTQVNINSDWRYGNLVYYDVRNMNSLIDAVGPDVFKYITHFTDFEWDSSKVIARNLSAWRVIEADTMISGTYSQIGWTDSVSVYPIDSVGGVIKFRASNDTTGIQIQLANESFKLDTLSIAANILYFGVRVNLEEDSTLTAFWGLLPRNDSVVIKNGKTDRNYDGMYFRLLDDSAKVQFVNMLNGTSQMTNVGTVAASTFKDSTWYKWEFYASWNGSSKVVRAYRDNTLVATHTTNQYICTDEELTPTLVFKTGRSAMYSRGMLVDWLRIIQIRVLN